MTKNVWVIRVAVFFFLFFTLSAAAGFNALDGTEASISPGQGADPVRPEKIVFHPKYHESCYRVEFESKRGQGLPCEDLVPLRYQKKSCENGQNLEIGTVDAKPSCSGKKRVSLEFQTAKEKIRLNLRIQHQPGGRTGYAAKYQLEKTEIESGISSDLPKPQIKKLEAELPEETPLRFKFSGFVWLEQERTSNFGYDVGSTGTPAQDAQQNFNEKVGQNHQSNTSIFSNLSFEVAKDRTSLVSMFEVGEIFFGDSYSGGGQGARASNVFEVRNFYLNQEFSPSLSARGGVVTTISDPRSFIFNDHLASLQMQYKTEVSEGLIWYGNASSSRVGSSKLLDRYVGAQGSLSLGGVKGTLYGVLRKKAGDTFAIDDGTGTFTAQIADSHYTWFGGTFSYEAPISVQATVIGNWGNSKISGGASDSFSSYLFDAKLSYDWVAPQIGFTAEAMVTPGASGVIESTTSAPLPNKRRHFVSPVSTAYLMTIATSDGLDDSSGTPKQSIIANLNQEEGLKILVLTSSFHINKDLTAFLRYGSLYTAVDSKTTKSSSLGQEWDVGAVYQMTPSTSLQGDYGRFIPGAFFEKRSVAQMFAAKVKFSF